MRSGFTLVELSIVLTIIALIAGGILVGRELLYLAQIKNQVDQVNEYNSAVLLFREKYNGMPGDLHADNAAQLGFVPRSGGRGHGDGNGILETCNPGIIIFGGGYVGEVPLGCEYLLFWSDLADAKLISFVPQEVFDGNFVASSFQDTLKYFPQLRIVKNATFLAVNHMGTMGTWLVTTHISSRTAGGSVSYTKRVIQAKHAYYLDKKMDDGLPLGGIIVARSADITPTDGGGFWFGLPETGPDRCVTPEGLYNINATSQISQCQINIKMGI